MLLFIFQCFPFAARPPRLSPFVSPSFSEIEKIQKDEEKEEEKFIDVVINKNMKLGQKILIPVKQFPKVSVVAADFSRSVRGYL